MCNRKKTFNKNTENSQNKCLLFTLSTFSAIKWLINLGRKKEIELPTKANT